MSLDLCRYCLNDYVVSIMFFELCLVDGVCWLVSRFWVHQDAGKRHVLWWITICDRFLEEKKTLLASFSVLYKICFQDWWFSWFVTRCCRKVFASIVERIVLTPKSSQEGLDSHWEGWHFSKNKENIGSTTAREQWLRDIASCSARHVKVFRWLSKRFWYNLKEDWWS